MKQTEQIKYGCAICGKGVQFANMVSFSKRRTKTIRRPNLHTHHISVEGQKVKIKACTSCKRSLREGERQISSVSSGRDQAKVVVNA